MFFSLMFVCFLFELFWVTEYFLLIFRFPVHKSSSDDGSGGKSKLDWYILFYCHVLIFYSMLNKYEFSHVHLHT